MKYVLDASVALKWVLPESLSPQAVRLRNDYRSKIHELIAPDSFPVEVAHGLTRAERKGIIKPPQGTARLANVFRFAPALHPYIPLLPRAFAISSAMRIGVYDCLYVALGEQEGCEVVTADQKMINALQKDFPIIRALATMR
jgi:predicted nucleic acid-binding protein